MGKRYFTKGARNGVRGTALLASGLVCGILVAGCGPTSGQLAEREAARSASQPPAPARTMIAGSATVEATGPGTTAPGTSTQTPAATTASPTASTVAEAGSPTSSSVPPVYTLAANQAGMDVPVQKACSQLLSRAADAVPAKSVSSCITAAMRSGTGANVVLETLGTGLPGGRHTAQLKTAPEFGMFLRSPEIGVSILLTGAEGRVLSDGEATAVDADGDPDERSAAIVTDAARILLDPERLGHLLGTAKAFRVDYAASDTGSATADAVPGAAVRLTAVTPGPVQGLDTVSLDMLVDPLYRPLQLNISGTGQGIPATTSVTYSDWGTPVHLPPAG